MKGAAKPKRIVQKPPVRFNPNIDHVTREMARKAVIAVKKKQQAKKRG